MSTVSVCFSTLVGDERALVDRRQERAVPQRRPYRRRHVRAEHDVARQVLVVGAETVGEPRADRRPAHLRVAGVHHQHRRLVVRNVGVHRTDEADVVRAFADVREQLADLDAGLAVLLEREGRAHQRAGLAFGGNRAARQRLSVVLVEHRLRIEAVDLRQAAVHEQKDDTLGARRVIEPPRVDAAVLGQRPGRSDNRLAHETGEREHAEPVAHAAERVAPSERLP